MPLQNSPTYTQDLEAERAAEKKRREMAIKASHEISCANFCDFKRSQIVAGTHARPRRRRRKRILTSSRSRHRLLPEQ